MWKTEHPDRKWTDKAIVFLTFGILLVGVSQAIIYFEEEEVMQRSIQQNERSIILGTGQLAVADRNAKTAEDTLGELKLGGGDTHKLAVAAGQQAGAAKDQAKALQDQVGETTKLTADAASANTIAAQAMEAQTRPWVGPTEDAVANNIVTTASSTSPSLFVRFHLKLRNYGQSAAVVVQPIFTFAEEYIYAKQDSLRMYDTCGEAVQDLTHMNQYLAAIFPGAETNIDVNAYSRFKENPTRPPAKRFDFLVGCIAYKGAGKTIYRTAAYYRVTYTDTLMTSRDGTPYYPVDHLELWWVEPLEDWSPRK